MDSSYRWQESVYWSQLMSVIHKKMGFLVLNQQCFSETLLLCVNRSCTKCTFHFLVVLLKHHLTNIYYLRWNKGLWLHSGTQKRHMTASFDVLVWDKYRWQDSFFHFLQFSGEPGFWDTAHNLVYLELLISRLIGSKSSAATRLAIILLQRWSNFNEFLFWHSYLASNNASLPFTVQKSW